MRAFEVTVNGQRVCTAGVGASGVLSALVTADGRSDDLRFTVGGLDPSKLHVAWEVPRIAPGDTVTIRNLEIEAVDRATTIFRAGTSYRSFVVGFLWGRVEGAVRAFAADPLGYAAKELRSQRDSLASLRNMVRRRFQRSRHPAPHTVMTVAVNGQRVCAAGVPLDGNLTAFMTWAARPDSAAVATTVRVLGLDSTAQQSVRWKNSRLALGDEVSIKVAPAERSDPPASRAPL